MEKIKGVKPSCQTDTCMLTPVSFPFKILYFLSSEMVCFLSETPSSFIIYLFCWLNLTKLLNCDSSRAVGYRFGPHLGETVPMLINYCTSASENDEELREYSLQVLY